MNISGIFSGARNIVLDKNQSNVVASLMKSKEKLLERIQEIQSGQEDFQTKQAEIQQLNEQIQQIGQQIAAAKLAERQQQTSSVSQNDTATETADDSTGVTLSASLTDLIAAGKTLKELTTIGNEKKKLENGKKTAEMEISTARRGGSIKSQIATINDADSKIPGLEIALGQKMGEASQKVAGSAENSQTDKASKDEQDNEKAVDSVSVTGNSAMAGDQNSSAITAVPEEMNHNYRQTVNFLV